MILRLDRLIYRLINVIHSYHCMMNEKETRVEEIMTYDWIGLDWIFID